MDIDKVMWASDFPHLESDWPNSQRVIAESFSHVPEDEKRKMIVGNAVGILASMIDRPKKRPSRSLASRKPLRVDRAVTKPRSTIVSTDQITDLGTLDAELAKESMRGLWVREEALRREPAPFGKPMLWKWSKIREGLEAGWEAGDFFVVPN
jgi:hypothetical protein